MVRIHVQSSPSVDDRTARLIAAVLENRWIASLALNRLYRAEQCILALASEQAGEPQPLGPPDDIDALVLAELRDFAKLAFPDVEIAIDPDEGEGATP
jgi:hypothetical protein